MDSKKSQHNVHADHGISKGKFVSEKRKLWRQNVLNGKKRKVEEPHPQEEKERIIIDLQEVAKNL